MYYHTGHTGIIHLLTVLAVILSMVNVNSQSIEDEPRPVTVKVGDTATLTCGVSGDVSGNSLEWWEYITITTGQRIFTTYDGVVSDPSKYEIEGTYNLKIENAQYSDGGEYGCKLVNDNKLQSADVVVIGTPLPIAPSTMEGENKTYACHVEYGSRLEHELPESHTPRLKSYADNTLLTDVRETLEDNDGYRTLKHTMNYIGNTADNGKNLTCEVTTSNPIYIDYGTKPIEVLFPVRDIEFAPINQEYFVGEHINCTASGNPAPSYTWTAVISNGPRTQSGSVLEFYDNMIGDNTWKCRASNDAGQSNVIEADTHSFQVVANPDPPHEDESTDSVDAGIIAVAVIVPLVVIAAIAIGAFFWWKRRKSQSTEEHTSPKHKEGEVNPQFNDEKPPINFDLSLDPQYQHIAENIPPQKTGRDSPGYGDLGIKQIHPAVNLGASFDDSSFEDREVNHKPPAYDSRPDTAV